ncbi:hypothetical protein Tco_0555755 [Tanacetum coccineum]
MGIVGVWALVGHWEGHREARAGVWNEIVKVSEDIDGVGLDFSSSCIRVLGDGRGITFWIDRWVDNRRLCDGFPSEDGEFTVKEITRLVEEKILHVESGVRETLWN